MNKVYRYDVHGKNILKTLNKYYANDLGIKQIKTNNENIKYSVALENIVYNDLISKNYKVFIGKTKKGEIHYFDEYVNKSSIGIPVPGPEFTEDNSFLIVKNNTIQLNCIKK